MSVYTIGERSIGRSGVAGGIAGSPIIELAASLTADADLTALFAAERTLAAALAASADIVGPLSVDRNVAAALAITIDATAAPLIVERGFAAALDPTADFVTSLLIVASDTILFVAAMDITGDVVAVLLLDLAYVAELAGDANLTALLSVDPVFVANLEASIDVVVPLSIDRRLGGVLVATIDMMARLSDLGEDLELRADVTATADLQALFGKDFALAPVPLSVSIDLAATPFRQAAFAATLQATGDAAVVLARDPGYLALLQADAELGTVLARDRGLVANLELAAELAGVLKIDPALAAALAVTIDLEVADILRRTAFRAALAADADLTVAFFRDSTLQAAVDVLGDIGAQLAGERPLDAVLAASVDLATVLDVPRDFDPEDLAAIVELVTSLTVDRTLDATCGEVQVFAATLGVSADLAAELGVDLGTDITFAALFDVSGDLTVALDAGPIPCPPFTTVTGSATLTTDRTLVAEVQAVVSLMLAAIDVELFVLRALQAWRVPGTATRFTVKGRPRTWRPESTGGPTWQK